MNLKNKLIVLWILLIMGMILHFNYHVGDIFYGIDVVRPNANGKVPVSTFVIRTIFYHLPIAWILIIIYANRKTTRLGLFILSIIYLLAHGVHLTGELLSEKADLSQMSLLTLVLLISGMTSVEHFKYWKESPG